MLTPKEIKRMADLRFIATYHGDLNPTEVQEFLGLLARRVEELEARIESS